MEPITEIQTKLAIKEDYAVSLEIDILSTKDQIRSEIDETHITFLNDHLNMQKFELDKVNVKIYLLRKKLKFAENQRNFRHQLKSEKQFIIIYA